LRGESWHDEAERPEAGAVKYVLFAVVVAAITVFAVQNNTPTTVRLFAWTFSDVTLAAVILGSLALGILLVGVPLGIGRWWLRSRMRSLQTRLSAAESRLDARSAGSSPSSRPADRQDA
jgi:uncharacterized integral membrane protein